MFDIHASSSPFPLSLLYALHWNQTLPVDVGMMVDNLTMVVAVAADADAVVVAVGKTIDNLTVVAGNDDQKCFPYECDHLSSSQSVSLMMMMMMMAAAVAAVL